MVLTEDTVASRLRKVDGTQDAIQTMSMWMLHYRDAASIQIIVSTWLNVFRTSNDDQRVNLFYVMNDVVMRAKRKTHNDELISAFRDQVIAAVSIGRSSDVVRRSMSKCILLFEEKKVFTQDIITELKKALEDIPDGEDFDFDQAKLHQDIEAYRKGDAVMEKAHGILKRSEFAFAQEIKARMKDRKEGVKLVNEVAAAVKKLDDFANTVKSHRQRCLNLIDMVENAKRAFATQLRDVTIVEDAYQKFFSGIREVRSELESMIKEGVYPGASPPHDAPSPTANDDIYAGGVEKVLQSIHAPGSRDNLETTDMDMDDDEVGVSSTVAAANARLAAQAITVPPPFTSNNGALNLANIPMPPLNVSTGMPGQMWPPPMTAPSPSKVGSIPTPSTPVTHANLPPPGAPPPIFSPNVPPPFPPFNVNIPPPQPGQGFTSPPPPLYSPSMPNWSGQYFPSTPTNPNFSQPPPQDGNFDNANNSGDFRRNSYGGGGPRGGRGGGFRGDFRGRGGFQGRRNTADGRFDDRGGRGGYRGGGGGGGYH